MMDRRRCPKMALASCSVPSPSGPRWRRAVSMLRMPSVNTEVLPTIPAIPHMLLVLQSCCGGHPIGQDGLEQRFIAFRAALDEKILDLFQVVTRDRGAPLRRVAQGAYRRVESLQVVQLDDI